MKKITQKLLFVFQVHRSLPFLFRYLFTRNNVPLAKKLFSFGLLVGYILLPADIVTDFIPVLGWVDDVTIVAFILDNMQKQEQKHAKKALHQTLLKQDSVASTH